MENYPGSMIDSSFWNGKKVLITGFSGFKGFWLNLILNKLGSEVYGVSKQNLNSQIFLEYSKNQKYKNNYLTDVADFKKLKNIIHEVKPDILFHFAAQPLVKTSKTNPETTLETNIVGTFNVLEIVKNSEWDIVSVIATTDKVYEFPSKNNKESDPLGSVELYSATKVSCENIINAYNLNEDSKNKFSIVRSGNVLGGGDGGEHRLLTDILYAIDNKVNIKIRNPNSIRPWQFILDSLGGYILTAQQHHNISHNIFNFSNQDLNELSVLELTNTILNKFSSDIKVVVSDEDTFLESEELRIDSSKAKNILNWNALYDLEDITEKLYEWEISKQNFNVIETSHKHVVEYLNKATN